MSSSASKKNSHSTKECARPGVPKNVICTLIDSKSQSLLTWRARECSVNSQPNSAKSLRYLYCAESLRCVGAGITYHFQPISISKHDTDHSWSRAGLPPPIRFTRKCPACTGVLLWSPGKMQTSDWSSGMSMSSSCLLFRSSLQLILTMTLKTFSFASLSTVRLETKGSASPGLSVSRHRPSVSSIREINTMFLPLCNISEISCPIPNAEAGGKT